MITKINVLGEEYSIDDGETLVNIDGDCDWTTKKIRICKSLSIDEEGKLKNLKLYKNAVVRHELIHAILHESGLDTGSNMIHNEESVDWIAKMFPKMAKIFNELSIDE